MTYAEMAKQAKRKKTSKKLSVGQFKFERKGQQLIGMYMRSDPITYKKTDKAGLVHTFMTDNGPVKLAGSHKIDTEIIPLLKEGGVYIITYIDDINVGQPAPMKDFECEEISTEGIPDA